MLSRNCNTSNQTFAVVIAIWIFVAQMLQAAVGYCLQYHDDTNFTPVSASSSKPFKAFF